MAAGRVSPALVLRYALRELRGGVRGFRVFLACLALGVFAIAAAGSTKQAVEQGLREDSQALLGGDVQVRLTYRTLSDAQRRMLAGHGVVADLREMRAMARTDGRQALVEVKAVDDAYPLYGAVALRPHRPLHEALAEKGGRWGAVAEEGLAARLGIGPGQTFTLGNATLELRAVITKEPDRVASVVAFGPRLMVSQEALAATGLVQPGSLIRNITNLRLTDGTSAQRLVARLNDRFPEAGWRLRTVEDAAPGLKRFLDNIALFLTLVGLTALLTGGIGVANAVKAYIDGRVDTIATLKTLGAPGRLVFRIYLVQIALLALLGIALGLLGGALAPVVAGAAAAGLLPVEARFGVYAPPLLEAAAFGALVAMVFGLWPLARTRDIPAAALFRSVVGGGLGWPRGGVAVVIGAAALALGVLTVVTATRQDVAAGFVAGALLALVLFRAMAWGVMRLARLPRAAGRPGLRLALANLHRPGAPTPSVVLSLGLGLSVLVAIALIEANLHRQIGERMPADAPAFYFIDIQGDQRDAFRAAVATVPEATILRSADMIRGSLVRLNGRPVDSAEIAPRARWVVRGDHGISTPATKPDAVEVSAGSWWPADYSGRPLISLPEEIAEGLGVGLGDSVTLNVLGRPITAEIANLRRVDWSSLSMNFAFLLNPGALDGAPRTWIATVAVPPEAETRLEAAVADALPNVSAIRVRDALTTVQNILGAAGQAVRATAAVTLLAGALVLAGAIAAGHRRRIYDAVVLKVLGAVRRDVLRTYLIEYGIMGAVTGLIAAGVGSVAAWAVLVFVMHADWTLLPGVVLGVAGVCVGLTLIGGFLGTWRALAAKAAPLLRNE